MANIVLMDGGMGQELIRRSANPAHPQWSAHVMMNEPEIVQQLHRDYLDAGARVLITNSYSTTRQRFEKFGMPERLVSVRAIAHDLVNRARDEAGVDARIAGCLSPLVGSYNPERLPSDAALLEEYRELVEMDRDRVDLFVCETMSKASEARMAAIAASESGKPVWVAWSLLETPGDDGQPRLRSGETVGEAMAALEGVPVDAILFNCCPPEMMTAGMDQLASDGRPFGGHANGFTPIPKGFALGQTVAQLSARRDLGPDAYADHVMGWIGRGATVVGGCCEVGPEHIRVLGERIRAAGHTIANAV